METTESLTKEFLAIQSNVQIAKKQYAKASADLAVEEKSLRVVQVKHRDAKVAYDKFQTESAEGITEIESKKTSVEQDLIAAEKKLETAKSDYKETLKSHEDLKQEIADNKIRLGEIIQSLENEIERKTRSQSSLANTIIQLTSEVSDIEDEIAILEQERDGLISDVAGQKALHADVVKRKETVESQIEEKQIEADEKNAELKRELSNLEGQIESSKKTLDQTEKQNIVLTSERDSLVSDIKNLRKEHSDLKIDVEAEKKKDQNLRLRHEHITNREAHIRARYKDMGLVYPEFND